MSKHREPPPEFVALKEEAEAQGCLYGMDFGIWYIPTMLSSEVLIVGLDGDEYTLRYSDMGHKRELFRSSDFAAFREQFLEEAARLAGPRGRGPYAGQPERDEYYGLTKRETFEKMQKKGLFLDLRFEDVFPQGE